MTFSAITTNKQCMLNKDQAKKNIADRKQRQGFQPYFSKKKKKQTHKSEGAEYLNEGCSVSMRMQGSALLYTH